MFRWRDAKGLPSTSGHKCSTDEQATEARKAKLAPFSRNIESSMTNQVIVWEFVVGVFGGLT
jgi:hypothetical protein